MCRRGQLARIEAAPAPDTASDRAGSACAPFPKQARAAVTGQVGRRLCRFSRTSRSSSFRACRARWCSPSFSPCYRGVQRSILHTITSLSPELTLQPLRHPLVHCFLPHSTHTRFSHPSGWPLQAEIGSSTSSQGMIMDSILLSWTRSSTWCAQLFLINCPRGVSVVAVWSHGATGLGPAELRGACVRFVGL